MSRSGSADWQSYNEIYGTTNNPFDLGRTPGGSSGGSSAALAAGYGPLSLGSDIGGSLRAPAHYCGIYAHKPTFGAGPLARPDAAAVSAAAASSRDLAVVGPMAAALDLSDCSMSSPVPTNRRPAAATGCRCRRRDTTQLKDFRILLIDSHPLMPTTSSVRSALDTLAGRLGKAGAQVARESALMPDSRTRPGSTCACCCRFLRRSFPPRSMTAAKAQAAAA